jgi:hypothetical protein
MFQAELKGQNMETTFTNLNTIPVTELTPEELALLAKRDETLMQLTVTTDDDEDEVDAPAEAPTLH